MSRRTGRPARSGGGGGGKKPLDLSVVGGALTIDSDDEIIDTTPKLNNVTSGRGGRGGSVASRATANVGAPHGMHGHAPPSPARGGVDPKRRRTNSGRHVLPPLSAKLSSSSSSSTSSSSAAAAAAGGGGGSRSGSGTSRGRASRASTSSTNSGGAGRASGAGTGAGAGSKVVWTCAQCTLANSVDRTRCEACDVQRVMPKPPRQPKSASSSSARGTANNDPITVLDSDDDVEPAAPTPSPRRPARGAGAGAGAGGAGAGGAKGRGTSKSGRGQSRARGGAAAAAGAYVAASTAHRTRGGGGYNSDYFAGGGGDAARAAALAEARAAHLAAAAGAYGAPQRPNTAKREEMQMETMMNGSIKEDQDKAYFESLSRDREKEDDKRRQETEDAENKRAEEEKEQMAAVMEQSGEQYVKETRARMRAAVPMEPLKGDEGSVLVALHLGPSGKRVQRRFKKTTTLAAAFNFVESHDEWPEELGPCLLSMRQPVKVMAREKDGAVSFETAFGEGTKRVLCYCNPVEAP